MTAATLLADLLARGARLEAEGDRLRVTAPPGILTSTVRARLAEHKAALLELLEPARASVQLSLDAAFPRATRMLELRVPWYTRTLWLVPTEHDAEILVTEGVSRGRVWTAKELADLLGVPGPAQTVARAKLEFNADVVAVRPSGAPA